MRALWTSYSGLQSDDSDASDVPCCALEAAGEEHDLDEVALCDSDAAEGQDGITLEDLQKGAVFLSFAYRGTFLDRQFQGSSLQTAIDKSAADAVITVSVREIWSGSSVPWQMGSQSRSWQDR